MKINKKEDKKQALILILLIIFSCMSIVMPISIYQLSRDYGEIPITSEETVLSYIQKLGPIGDFMAGTTVPFLTFAGFLLLIFTTTMQKQQLDLTRSELIETQKIFKEQSETMLLQRFESTFFQLFSMHNDIVSSLKFKMHNRSYIDPEYKMIRLSGRECFSRYKILLFKELKNQNYTSDIDGLHQLYVQIRSDYSSFSNENIQDLGHYFRNLYRVIKFIDEFNDLPDQLRNDYVDLIRAHFSSDEVSLLLYNGLSKDGEAFVHYIKNMIY